MAYPVPGRVPLPTFRPQQAMQPGQGMMGMAGPTFGQQAPQPAQPQGNRFMQAISQNPEVLLALGSGLLGGRTGSEQWSGGLGAMSQAMGTASERRKEEKKKNETMEWLRKQAPEYAQAVEMGALSLSDAYKMKLDAQKPQKPSFINAGEGRLFNENTGEWITAPGGTNKPLSSVGKINADFNAGLIDQATRDALIQKAAQSEGMEIVSDGQGGFTMRQGLGVGGGKMSNQDTKNEANMVDAARQSAASATELKQTINMLRSANKDTGYSGPGGGMIGTGLDVAEKLGIDTPGSPGSRAIMRSGGLEVALQKVQQTKGAISNAEMNLFMAASPGMQQSEEGNAALLDMAESIADRAIQRVQEMEAWRQRNGTVQGFESAWSEYINSNPIVTEDKILRQTPPGAQGGVQSYRDYFGGN